MIDLMREAIREEIDSRQGFAARIALLMSMQKDGVEHRHFDTANFVPSNMVVCIDDVSNPPQYFDVYVGEAALTHDLTTCRNNHGEPT